MSKTTKTPLRNLQHPLWLHNDPLETPKRRSTFQDGIDMKIYMQLPQCFLGTSNMSNTTNTPLRNLQHPRRLPGRQLEDTLEKQRVGTLSRNAEIWKFIHSFLDVSFRHQTCQEPPRLLSGTFSVLLDFKMMLWRHIGDEALSRKVEI